jgi:hypothetical protein
MVISTALVLMCRFMILKIGCHDEIRIDALIGSLVKNGMTVGEKKDSL